MIVMRKRLAKCAVLCLNNALGKSPSPRPHCLYSISR